MACRGGFGFGFRAVDFRVCGGGGDPATLHFEPSKNHPLKYVSFLYIIPSSSPSLSSKVKPSNFSQILILSSISANC